MEGAVLPQRGVVHVVPPGRGCVHRRRRRARHGRAATAPSLASSSGPDQAAESNQMLGSRIRRKRSDWKAEIPSWKRSKFVEADVLGNCVWWVPFRSRPLEAGLPGGAGERGRGGEVNPRRAVVDPVYGLTRVCSRPSGDLWMWKAGGFHGRLYWVQLGICHSLAVLLTGQSTMRSQT